MNIKEAAFIPHIDTIYGSAQQTLATARQQAIKNNYPFFTLVTSTPNGTQGVGEWFYKRWNGALESDVLFQELENNKEDWINEDIQQMVDDPNLCNGFIKTKYHWSEDPTKDQIWYSKQCQELDDKRKINQELDLVFVGTQYCIFDDDLLVQIKPMDPVFKLHVPPTILPNTWFDLYEMPSELDEMDYYLIGVDTASSMRGAYNSIEIFSFRDFNQIGEFNYKVNSSNKYSKIVDFIFRWLRKIVGDRVIIGFENNTIGKAPIENLLELIQDINYRDYLYTEDPEKFPGINTNGITKEFMIGCFIEYLKENPAAIKSKNLFNQLSSVERTTSGNIQSKNFTDMFMACCFCAMVRKRKAIEIGPLLGVSNKKISEDRSKLFQNIINLNNPKKGIIQDQFSNPFKEKDEDQVYIMTAEEDYERHKGANESYQENLFADQIKLLSDVF